jgi:hypothetical protein
VLIIAFGLGALHVLEADRADAQQPANGTNVSGYARNQGTSNQATSLAQIAALGPPSEQASEPWTDALRFWNSCRSCPYPPGRMWASAEYLLWWTKGSPLPPLLTTSPTGSPFETAGILGLPTTTILLGNENVNTGLRSGGRFTLGGWLNPEHTTGIEANFFVLATQVSHFSAVSDGSPILARPFANLDPTSPFFNTQDSLFVAFPGLVKGDFHATTTSEFLGTDVYLRQALCCGCNWRVDGLLGYRYLRLREGLSIAETEISTDPTNAAFGLPLLINEGFNTTNNFHGGEFGLMGEAQRDRWFIRGVAKVALGGTCQTVGINGTTAIGSNPPSPGGFLALPSNIGQYHASKFAVVPEIGINLGYAITRNVRVFAGYTFLYWSNVVRPGDQVDLRVNTTQPNIGNGLVGQALPAFTFNQSSFWAQGINFGLELRY